MASYRNILSAVDLSPASEPLVRRATDLADRFGASLALLHVVEYVPVEPMGEALLPSVELRDELVEAAQKKLDVLATRCGASGAARHVRIGNTKAEIVHVAHELSADLIVLGAHERHGLAILVNRTEDTVLHAAPCDVLAVRIDAKGRKP